MFSVLLVWSQLVFAGPSSDLKPLFAEHFRDHYAAGRCGTNVLAFLSDIAKNRGSVDGLYLVMFENNGFSGFGMVNVEAARDYIRDRWVETEKNWYHHVVAMDKSGLIYDFDFTVKPRIVKGSDYIESMFLNETECTGQRSSGEFCIGRDTKLNEYSVKVLKASEALAGGDASKAKSMSLKKFYATVD